MVVRNSYLYGRTTGLLEATGVAAGVLVHVTYTMLGVGLLIASSTALFTAIKLAGAAYLVYIGVRTFFARNDLAVDLESKPALTRLGALRTGFLTNALNPKTTLFVVSTFTQVVGEDTGLWQQADYGLFMSAAHLGWFALVALEPGPVHPQELRLYDAAVRPDAYSRTGPFQRPAVDGGAVREGAEDFRTYRRARTRVHDHGP